MIGGNIMKKVALFLSGIAGIALASCGPQVTMEGIGYGLTHDHYVGVVSLTTLNDEITEISIEEYFLPYNWAKVSEADATAYAEDTLAAVGSRGTSYYAKYIQIGDKLLTGTVIGESGSQKVEYAATGIEALEAWVAIEANAQWYVEQVEGEAFYLATAAGIEHPNLVRFDATSNVAMTKSASGYWSGSNYPLGWAGNMDAIEDLLLGTTLNLDPADFEQNEDGFWASGDVVTGATLSDFADYIAVALRAYANRVEVTE
jgi:hypothetical protein